MQLHITVLGILLVAAGPPASPQGTCPMAIPNEFKIELTRLGVEDVTDKDVTGKEVKAKRVYGDIGINNQNFGRFYENPTVMIPEGTYLGNLRYQSDHNFVVSSCGVAARKGDFLIEVSDVKNAEGKSRSNILFHPGILPSHSKGCVLFGARTRDQLGNLLPLDATYPLVKIRKAFYGTDDPVQCPNKVITITVKGNPQSR